MKINQGDEVVVHLKALGMKNPNCVRVLMPSLYGNMELPLGTEHIKAFVRSPPRPPEAGEVWEDRTIRGCERRVVAVENGSVFYFWREKSVGDWLAHTGSVAWFMAQNARKGD